MVLDHSGEGRLMRVKPAPIEVKINYKPLVKQGQFHGMADKFRLFAGGWGNGKTSAGCVEGLALALEYPGSVGLICRKTRPELKATTQDVFFNGGRGGREGDFEGCPSELIRSFNKTEQKLTLINNSVIYFWPLDDPAKLTNINLGWFLIDQAEEVDEDMFLMLRGRLRQRNAPRKGMLLANPAGHDWIWKRWIYLKYPQHGLVHATTLDNPNLPHDYIENLMEMPEAWRNRFIYGSWDVFEGQIWPEFDPDVHTVQPFVIPDWFECVEGIDHGRRNPTAILWVEFDDQGNCFVVDEHLVAGKLVTFHANALLERRQVWGEANYTVIDASAAALDPNTGRSVIDEYWDHGIITIPSDRHVIARINRVAEWLRLDPEHPHPITGETREEGWPHLYIFKNCVNLIEHIQQYQWKRQPVGQYEDAKEKPREKDDHDVDALGYILMTRPSPAEKPVSESRGSNDWYWQRIRDKMDRVKEAHSLLGTEA
jgi:phage terminase large subunit